MLPCRNVGIIYSDEYLMYSSKHPKYLNRYEIVINLIKAYDLFDKMNIFPAALNKDNFNSFLKTLTTFHSQDYLMAIKELSCICESDNIIESDVNFEEFGLVYDCSGFPGLLEFSLSSVAGTMVAAQSLALNKTQICINWAGGWHHAKKFEASGFCYLNDIVYGIMILMNRFRRILYIDIDLHHGDGVEEAFLYSSRVFTLSFHYSSPGFFPASSENLMSSTGYGKGQYSAAQFTYSQEGISDFLYCSVFDSLFDIIVPAFDPDVIVLQCGTDGLCTDPHKIFNLTHRSYEHVIMKLLSLNLPLLVLGGGGYNYSDTAKVWTRITSLLLGHELLDDIPDHENILLYGPCFESTIDPSYRSIIPNKVEINSQIEKIVQQMENYKNFKKSITNPLSSINLNI